MTFEEWTAALRWPEADMSAFAARFPRLFSEREPSTPWYYDGITCGPGWAQLIASVFEVAEARGATVAQVKEKWGTLRVYLKWSDEETERARMAAEAASAKVCEVCGEPGDLAVVRKTPRYGGRVATVCATHLPEGGERKGDAT